MIQLKLECYKINKILTFSKINNFTDKIKLIQSKVICVEHFF